MNQQQIQVGQRVHCILYGGTDGTVVAINGDQGLGRVSRQLGNGVIVTGGVCFLDVVWDKGSQSRGVPEAILRGVQWRVYDDVVDAAAVADAIARAAIYDADMKAKGDAAAQAMRDAMAAARVAGLKLGLMPADDFRAAGKRGTAAAYNLRLQLKAAGIKVVSMRGDYNSIRIQVADAAQCDRAKQIAAPYKAGSFDGMSDCYDYDPSAWGRVFGDVQYVFVSRA